MPPCLKFHHYHLSVTDDLLWIGLSGGKKGRKVFEALPTLKVLESWTIFVCINVPVHTHSYISDIYTTFLIIRANSFTYNVWLLSHYKVRVVATETISSTSVGILIIQFFLEKHADLCLKSIQVTSLPSPNFLGKKIICTPTPSTRLYSCLAHEFLVE